MALHLSIRPLKTRSGLEPVPRYEPSTSVRRPRTVFILQSWTTGYEGRKEMAYLTMHSTHFIYGYMPSDIIW